MTNQTQKEWVIEQLRKNGKISRNHCLREYISRLSAIIATLESEGYEFFAEYVDTVTRWGNGKDYMYKLVNYKEVFSKVEEEYDEYINLHVEYICDEAKVMEDEAMPDDVKESLESIISVCGGTISNEDEMGMISRTLKDWIDR